MQRAYAAERKAIPKHQPAPQHPLLDTPTQGGATHAKTTTATSPAKPTGGSNPLFDDPLSSALALETPGKPTAPTPLATSDGMETRPKQESKLFLTFFSFRNYAQGSRTQRR